MPVWRAEPGAAGRTVKRLALIAALLLGLVAAFWAGRVTTRPAPVPTDAPAEVVLARVTEQTVGRVLNLSVTVQQPLVPVAANALPGVVTAVGKGGVVKNGDILYAVNNVPVRVVASPIPFYRALTVGVKGPDVKALREALVALGHAEIAGETYTEATAAAVKEWQKSLGAPVTGTVALGELVAIPRLPSAVVLDRKILIPGAKLAGDEKLVQVPSGTPIFTLVLTRDQATLIPATATVQVPWQKHTWPATISSSEANDQGQTVLTLQAPDGGPVCGAQCAEIAAGGTKYLMSRIQVVPPATGPAVPVTAISTDASGQASVLVVNGDQRVRRAVQVKGTQDGVSVVSGVTVGETVQVFAGAQPATPGQPAASGQSQPTTKER